MKRTTLLLSAALAALLLLPATARAGSFSLQGAYWEPDASDDALGAGATFAWDLSRSFDLELRSSYYEELTSNAFDNIGGQSGDFFLPNGLQALPVELGLRYHFLPGGQVDTYIAGGGSYFLLDSDAGNIDDEFGFYGAIGIEFGDDVGPAFFVEAIYRKVEGTVEVDPNRLDDIDDLGFDGRVSLDLDGAGVNVGVVWGW